MGLISRVSIRTYRDKKTMTTAHRPTWDAAVAGTKRGESDLGKLSQQWSSRDAPSHRVLKSRKDIVPVRSVLSTARKNELKRKLEENEKKAARDALKKTAGNEHLDDEEIEKKRLKFEQMDKDDPLDSSSDESEEDSDEDDTEELMAELAKIKRERAEEEAKKAQEQKEKAERAKTEKLVHGNPLIDIANKLSGDG